MKKILQALLICIAIPLFGSNELNEIAVPSWVKKIPVQVNEDRENEGGGYNYLLIDLQDNVDIETGYRHYAVHVTNPDGVQEMSTINVSFDPTYQDLYFHEVSIIRAGNKIDKLSLDDFQLIQREESMERSLYDGSLSAILNLSDVKVGDIIEYSYSIKGYNPLYKGHYSTIFYHNYNISIDRIYNRVIASRDLNYKLENGASEPSINQKNGTTEYIWDVIGEDVLLYDANVPSWLIAQKFVSICSFDSWSQVASWFSPLYEYDTDKFDKRIKELNYSNSGELNSRILGHIRFVQDDIRYLGFESGIGAHKPNSPDKVMEQGYGDCKDKSLLLVALLRKDGIDANPVLVNTIYGEVLDEWLPSHGAFDHCIVSFNVGDSTFYVDPTISNQGGQLTKMYTPSYKNGLILSNKSSDLTPISVCEPSTISIKEIIDVHEIGGSATYTIRSEYTGSRADYIRSDFAANSKEVLEKSYLNFYSGLYPNIEKSKDLKFFDYDRNTTNKVVIEEEYIINDLWQDSEDQTYIYAETYPLVLENLTNYTNSVGGSMPYHLGTPYRFEQDIQVILPEEWNVTPDSKVIEEASFRYTNNMSGSGKRVFVNHTYEVYSETIDGTEVPDFLRKHDEIRGDLSFYLTYNESLIGSSNATSWFSIVLTVLALGTGIFFAIKLYYQYDPEPWKYAEDKPIGGWLILPTIGISLTPIVLILQLVQGGFFSKATWMSIMSLESNNVLIAAVFASEIVYNFLLLVFSVFLIILIYKRRTSAPKLVVFFYVANFAFPIIDHLAIVSLGPELLSPEDTSSTIGQSARQFIGAAIWIPYFLIAERVKSTFCKRVKPDHYYLDLEKEQ